LSLTYDVVWTDRRSTRALLHTWLWEQPNGLDDHRSLGHVWALLTAPSEVAELERIVIDRAVPLEIRSAILQAVFTFRALVAELALLLAEAKPRHEAESMAVTLLLVARSRPDVAEEIRALDPGVVARLRKSWAYVFTTDLMTEAADEDEAASDPLGPLLVENGGDLRRAFVALVRERGTSFDGAARWLVGQAWNLVRGEEWATDVLEQCLLLPFPADGGPRAWLTERLVEQDRARGYRHIARHYDEEGIARALRWVLETRLAEPTEVDHDFVLAVLRTARLHEVNVVLAALERARDCHLLVPRPTFDRLLASSSPLIVTATRAWLAWRNCQRSREWVRHALRTGDADTATILSRWLGADPDSGRDSDALRVALGRCMLMPPLGSSYLDEGPPRYEPRHASRVLCIALARAGSPAAKTVMLRYALSRRYGIVGTARALLEELAHGGTVPRRPRVWGTGALQRGW
jgi:hypothetical protein